MHRSRLPSSKARLSRKLIAYDVLCAFGAPAVAFWIRSPSLLDVEHAGSVSFYCVASALISIAAFVGFRIGHGIPQFFSFKDAVEIAKASFSSVAVISLLTFSATRLDDVPRSVPIIHFFVLSAALIAGRVWRRASIHRRDLGNARWIQADLERPVLLVGVSRLAWFYLRMLDTFPFSRRRVVGLIDASASVVGRTMYGQIVFGRPQDINQILDDFKTHGVTIAELLICDQRPAAVEIYRDLLAEQCRAKGVALVDLADELGLANLQEPDSSDNPDLRVPLYLQIRPYFDSVLSAMVLVFLAPVLLAVAAGVYLSLGPPVFFWQRRLGRHGYPIFVYKFRSMRNPVDGNGRVLPEEERHSLFGQFLRATRLDELPQLLNVARGDMAIIGPRPLLPHDQPDDASVRLSAAPGITGWAQVRGGKLVSVEAKNAMDEFYVLNASLKLDIKIVLATVVSVLFGDRLKDPVGTGSNAPKPNNSTSL